MHVTMLYDERQSRNNEKHVKISARYRFVLALANKEME
jgi:hypothetical protein